MYTHRFLFEFFAKYLHKHSALLNVCIHYNTTINIYVSEHQAGSLANIVDDYTCKKQKTQQSTMSENSHHHDDKGDDPFNYSHDTWCPTCQDRLIVESDAKGCDNRIFCKFCDFGCPECQCRWDEIEEMVENFLEDDFILTRMKFDDITASRACNLLYKFLIRVYCGPFLGKCIRMELPDCCLKGV